MLTPTIGGTGAFDPNQTSYASTRLLALTDTVRHSGTPQSAGPYKAALKAGYAVLAHLFDHGHDIVELVHARAHLVDRLLQIAWAAHRLPDSLALVAVGGYGRGELHPYSDVDVMVLTPGEDGSRGRHHTVLEAFITFLWDTGLEIGSSVRSVAAAHAHASADITVMTNLMESRLIVGSEQTHRAMINRIGPTQIWSPAAFFQAKLQEQQARHHRFHDSGYRVEPNIKESPGGLRDLQLINWALQRNFGLQSLEDLVDIGFLKGEECQTLIRGRNYLWTLRFASHLLANRREDRLLLDHQIAMARRFGYEDGDGQLGVEPFMQGYYRTVQQLSRLNEMLLQLLHEEVLNRGATDLATPLDNTRYQTRHGFVEYADKGILQRFPFALLEIFLIMAQNPQIKGIRARTIRLIRNNLWRIDDNFRADLRARSLFLEFLRQPQGISHGLRRMHRYGVLGAYWPALARVTGRMQYDLFHVYTVDEHTLMVLRNARRLMLAEHRHEVPFASMVANNLARPHVLYIAALFHDIGKGRGGDHSILGALDAREFCDNHNIGRFDTNLIVWLVENHLLMSITTQRKDISDPEEIHHFARLVGSSIRLDYLYLLTVADIRGTNPDLWNDWRDSLLRELYQATRAVLRRGVETVANTAAHLRDIKADALAKLSDGAHRLPEPMITALWANVGDDYFLRHSSAEIAWHTESICRHRQAGNPLPLITLSNSAARAGTAVFIYTHNAPFVFANSTAVLAQQALTILDARIITTGDGHTCDSYVIFDENDAPLHDPHRQQTLTTALLRALADGIDYDRNVHRRISRQMRHFRIPTGIELTTDARSGLIRMELITSDRPGLLSVIGERLAAHHLNLVTAKIATLGERAEDVFLISTADRALFDDPQAQHQFTRDLEQAIATLD